MPKPLAMASAVCLLSPVIITTLRPKSCNALIDSGVSCLIGSDTAIIAANLPSTATYIGDLPSAAKPKLSVSNLCRSKPKDFIKRSAPISTLVSLTIALTPIPVMDSN